MPRASSRFPLPPTGLPSTGLPPTGLPPTGLPPTGLPPTGLPLVLLLLASTLTVMAGAIISPVLGVIQADLGVSGTAAGLVLSAHALSIAVSSPLVGAWIDRVGHRRPLAVGLLVYGLAGAAGLVSGDSYPLLLISRLVFGVGAAAVFAGTTVALLSLHTGARRDRVMGWRGSALSVGGLVWPLAGGGLGALSWHAPFGIYLVGVPLGLAALWVLPSDRADTGPDTGPGPDAGSGTDADTDTAGSGGARRRVPAPAEDDDGSLLARLRSRPVILACFGLLAAGSALLFVLAVFLPLRFTELGVADPFLISVYSLGSSVAMTAAGLVYVPLLSRIGYTGLLRVAALLWVVSFGLLGTSDQVAVLVPALALFGVGMGTFVPAATVLMSEAAPASLRGRVVSWSSSATFLGQFVSPLLVGPLVDAGSITTGFLAAAGFAALLLAGLFVTRVGRGRHHARHLVRPHSGVRDNAHHAAGPDAPDGPGPELEEAVPQGGRRTGIDETGHR